MAFAIGRALGPAVVRNRLRRRLRPLIAAGEWPPGWYLVGARRGAVERSSSELMFDVTSLSEAITSVQASTTHDRHG